MMGVEWRGGGGQKNTKTKNRIRCWGVESVFLSSNVFTGQECEYMEGVFNPCEIKPCLNGGECIPFEMGYKCNCPFGAAGQNCEYDQYNDCTSVPCRNGGQCIDKIGEY